MSSKDVILKFIFGIVIFLFSLALVYFTANYASENSYLDYWLTLVLFAAAYLIFGMLVAGIFAISFGFLFSADVVILHLLVANFGQWPDSTKALAVFGILVLLYIIAYFKFPDTLPVPIAAPTQTQA